MKKNIFGQLECIKFRPLETKNHKEKISHKSKLKIFHTEVLKIASRRNIFLFKVNIDCSPFVCFLRSYLPIFQKTDRHTP